MTDTSTEAVEATAIHTGKACKCEFGEINVSETIRALASQRDDLLESLEIMCRFIETGSWPDRDPVQIARAAIARAKGGAQ